MLLVLVGAAAHVTAGGVGAGAQAATSGCTSSGDHLVVTQTSTMVGLAPGVAPRPITGRVVNVSDERTDITDVEVEIAAVSPAAGAAVGPCDASDYQISSTRMPVGRVLGPEGSTSFRGASIGFSDKPSNQDACQGATVHLHYTVNPR